MQNDAIMHSVGDTLAVSIIVGYFFSALPPIATLMTIIWLGLRIYETCTVQSLVGKHPRNCSQERFNEEKDPS